jgi:hypothetical protein
MTYETIHLVYGAVVLALFVGFILYIRHVITKAGG